MRMQIFSLMLFFCSNTILIPELIDFRLANTPDFYAQNNKSKKTKSDCAKVVDKDSRLLLPVESVNGIILQIIFESDMNIGTGDIVKIYGTLNEKRVHKANGFVSSTKDSLALIEIVHFFNTTEISENDEIEFVYKKYYGESAGAFIKKYFSDSTFQVCRTVFPFNIEVWKTGIKRPDEIIVYDHNSEYFDFRNLRNKHIGFHYRLTKGMLDVHLKSNKGLNTDLNFIFMKKKERYYLVKVVDKSLK